MIALRDKIFEEYTVDIMELEEEGFLTLKLTNKYTEFTCAIIRVYIAPEIVYMGIIIMIDLNIWCLLCMTCVKWI